ncbi:MAG TPA: hypothetical protein VKW77_02680 [Acidimicrobiales bacterium]|nr:hypothetical protein [Acidimicrobiales bacterium]
MIETTCREFHELSAELALGIADARERAAALGHLEHCAACRAELRELTDVADAVTALAPAVEPPAGFETRLLTRLAEGDERSPARLPTARPRPARARAALGRRWLAAAVAAAAALVVGTAGWAIGDQTGHSPALASGHVVVARLASNEGPAGQVVVQTTAEPWISMAVSLGRGDGTVRCQVRTTGGRSITVGWFGLSRGNGYWAAPIEAAAGTSLNAAEVTDMSGHVLARAALPSVQIAASSYR